MLVRREIDIGVPNLVECVDGGANHTRQGLDGLKFAEICRSKSHLYSVLQRVRINRLDKAARQPGGYLVHRPDLETVRACASRFNACGMACELCMDDDGSARHAQSNCHRALPFLGVFFAVLVCERERGRAFTVRSRIKS